MAEDDKPQRKRVKKTAVKKAAKKKSPAQKRAAPQKVAVKKHAAIKHASPTASAKTHASNDMAAEGTHVEVVLAQTAATESPRRGDTSRPARHVWWRAAIMVGVVVLVFAYIRNTAHDSGAVTAKSVAPSPWATETPSEINPAKTHPWELTPVPQGKDFGTAQPYYAPQNPQGYPKLEPWQPPPSVSGTNTQPYYPPPPGYYGHPSTADTSTPYQQ